MKNSNELKLSKVSNSYHLQFFFFTSAPFLNSHLQWVIFPTNKRLRKVKRRGLRKHKKNYRGGADHKIVWGEPQCFGKRKK